TGTIPPPAPPSQLPPPPTANQYSSNEIIDAGHRFFGGVSRDLAGMASPMAIFLVKRRAALLLAACAMATARFIQEMSVTCACSGKDRASGLTFELTVHGR